MSERVDLYRSTDKAWNNVQPPVTITWGQAGKGCYEQQLPLHYPIMPTLLFPNRASISYRRRLQSCIPTRIATLSYITNVIVIFGAFRGQIDTHSNEYAEFH